MDPGRWETPGFRPEWDIRPTLSNRHPPPCTVTFSIKAFLHFFGRVYCFMLCISYTIVLDFFIDQRLFCLVSSDKYYQTSLRHWLNLSLFNVRTIFHACQMIEINPENINHHAYRKQAREHRHHRRHLRSVSRGK